MLYIIFTNMNISRLLTILLQYHLEMIVYFSTVKIYNLLLNLYIPSTFLLLYNNNAMSILMDNSFTQTGIFH